MDMPSRQRARLVNVIMVIVAVDKPRARAIDTHAIIFCLAGTNNSFRSCPMIDFGRETTGGDYSCRTWYPFALC